MVTWSCLLGAIGFEYFLDSKDMLPAMNCYSVGYPYFLAEQDPKKVTPWVFEGIISNIDKSSNVYVTTPILQDNYGCPLLVWKSPFGSNGSINIGSPSLYFGGIMTKTISLESGTDKDCNFIVQPLYLSKVPYTELIKNLLFSPEALTQKTRMNKKNEN